MNEASLSTATMVGETAVAKSARPVLNFVTLLNPAGIASTLVPSKIEGLAFGPKVLGLRRRARSTSHRRGAKAQT